MKYQGVHFTPTGAALATEIALGGSPTPGFVIGGGIYETVVFSASINEVGDGGGTVPADIEWEPSTLAMVGPFFDIYPVPSIGFHFQSAAGIAVLSAGRGSGTVDHAEQGRLDVGDGLEPRTFSGAGLMFGVGFEGWIGNQWSMGFLARLTYASVASDAPFTDPRTGTDHDVEWRHTVVVPALLWTTTLH